MIIAPRFISPFNISARISRGFDPDAQAFIDAAGITDPTQQNAINALVLGLKADSIWTKMKVIYPFVGGTATTHKFNLKDPRDLDVAFRIDFFGGMTHSSTGAQSDGINGYGQTHYIPSVNGLLDSAHVSFYSRTDENNTVIEIGVRSGASLDAQFLEIRTSNQTFTIINQRMAALAPADLDSLGLYSSSRTSSILTTLNKNGSTLGSNATPSVSRPTKQTYIFAFNDDGTDDFHTNKECAFASIGDGLTVTDQNNLDARVDAFETTLGRQVV